MLKQLSSFVLPWWVKPAAIASVLAASFAMGYAQGADSVQAKWDKDKNLTTIAALDMQIEWRKQSAKYQNIIAKQKQQIQSNKKEVAHEISSSYGGCVANAGIVELWQNSFLVEPAPR